MVDIGGYQQGEEIRRISEAGGHFLEAPYR